jgi:lipid-A-disaccharide synthase
MKIFFSAGEPSGDLHGANLIRELRAQRPAVEAVGYGGPRMAEAGCRLHADLTALAVMWILRALMNLHKFLDLAGRADRYFRAERPDAVVLIDFPGFNWWIARRAKAHGIPVFYYAPPQIWAWASWRVGKMRRLVDHVLAALPFEANWLRERGCRATFVGHPYFDELRQQTRDAAFIDSFRDASRPLVVILPGSRNQELVHNLDSLLDAARHIAAAVPHARFAVAAFKPAQAETARRRAAALGIEAHVFAGRTPELIHLADACLAVSGSVSLELLYNLKPTVILYRVGWVAYRLQAWFRRVRYITLVNLLASDDIFNRPIASSAEDRAQATAALFPEFVTAGDRSREMAAHVIGWLRDPQERGRLVDRLETLRSQVALAGAGRRAAQIILSEARRQTKPTPRPHYPGWPTMGEAPRDAVDASPPRRAA